MDPKRREELIEFVKLQIAEKPKAVRMWSIIILVLCLVLLGILGGVYFDGAGTMDDIGLPLAFAGGFTLFGIGGIAYAVFELGGLDEHPLVVALRKDPPDIAKTYHVTVYRRGGQWPALGFVFPDGGEMWIAMDEPTRAEFEAWLRV